MKCPTIQIFTRNRLVLISISLGIIFTSVAGFGLGCRPGASRSQEATWELSQFQLSSRENFTEPHYDINGITLPQSSTINIEQGKIVYIKALITNIGALAGDYEWNILLDGETIYPSAPGTVHVEHSMSTEAFIPYQTPDNPDYIGVHEVKIGTVSLHFTVYSHFPAQISNLVVVPEVFPEGRTIVYPGEKAYVHPGEKVFPNYTVSNPGTIYQEYNVNFMVDGNKVDSRLFQMDPHEVHHNAVFTLNTTGYSVGTHIIMIYADNSLSYVIGEFEVVAETGESVSGLSTNTSTAATPDANPTTETAIPIPPLTLVGMTFSDGVVGELYTSTNVKPSGGKTPYSFSVTTGSLPDGLRIIGLDDHFRIEGTPTSFGAYAFDVTVNNSGDTTGGVKASFKLTVIPNLGGKWQMTTTVTQANGVCAGEGGTRVREITVTQKGENVTFSGFMGVQTNQLSGEILPPGGSLIDVANDAVILNNSEKWEVWVTGSYSEDGGITNSTRRLVIDTATTMSGVEDWSWVGGGGSCPGGKASVTATKVTNP